MKIRLLNNGGYGELNHITFPIVVDGEWYKDTGFDVKEEEFHRYGLDEYDSNYPFYFSLIFGECEVLK